jgi:hypothetical protein
VVAVVEVADGGAAVSLFACSKQPILLLFFADGRSVGLLGGRTSSNAAPLGGGGGYGGGYSRY